MTKVWPRCADVTDMVQMDLPLSEENGLTLWHLVEALQEAAQDVALTDDEAEALACIALSDLIEGGIVSFVGPSAPAANDVEYGDWDQRTKVA